MQFTRNAAIPILVLLKQCTYSFNSVYAYPIKVLFHHDGSCLKCFSTVVYTLKAGKEKMERKK